MRGWVRAFAALGLATAMIAGPAVPAPAADELPNSAKTWYFSEGTTLNDFYEYLVLLNPDPAADAHVHVDYQLENPVGVRLPSVGQDVTVGAGRRFTIPVFDAVGRGIVGVSAKLTSDRQFVAERVVYFAHGFDVGLVNGAHDTLGVNAPSPNWFFAEGSTLASCGGGTCSGFQPYFSVQNTSGAAANVVITYYTNNPNSTVTRTISVPDGARVTTDVTNLTGSALYPGALGAGFEGFGTAITSSRPVVVERAVYVRRDFPGIGTIDGATAERGTPAAAATSLFAEGTVLDGFFEFLTLFNPNNAAAALDVEYRVEGRTAPVTKSLAVPGRSRRTIQVFSETDPAGLGRAIPQASAPGSAGVSALIRSTNGVSFVAERSLYFAHDFGDGAVNGAHGVMGVPLADASWFLAEGTLRPGFREYLTIMNPNPAAARARIDYFRQDAPSLVAFRDLPANSRVTIVTFDPASPGGPGLPAPAPVDFGVRVTSVTSGGSPNSLAPIVVERPIYVRASVAGSPLIDDGHDSLGFQIIPPPGLPAVNTSPVTASDSYMATEDVLLTVPAPGVLGNDSDPDGDPITAAVARLPNHGSLTLAANGSFQYLGAPNFNGVDNFTYRAGDGTTPSPETTVTITVAPVNDPPVAVNDAYSTPEDVPLVVPAPGVLGNDSDPDGSQLTATVVTTTIHGTLVLNANGSFTYAPAPNFNGPDSFTYRVTDGLLTSTLATVTLSVTANEPPVAVDDQFTGAVGNTRFVVSTTGPTGEPQVTAVGNILTNDTDVDGPSQSAVGGDITSTNGGSVSLNNNGTFTYLPPAGFVGNDAFDYTVSDGAGGTDVGKVTITVASRVWYVNSASLAGGPDGRSASPFLNLSSLNGPGGVGDVDFPTDIIFVYPGSGSYSGGLPLEADQKLFGRSHGLVVGSTTILTPSGGNPTILNAGGNAITLGLRNQIQGVNTGNSTGAGISGSAFVTATIGTLTSVSVANTTGPGVSFTSGTLDATIANLSSSNATNPAISLVTVNGTFSAPAGSISSITGTDILLDGGGVNFTYAGSDSNNNGRSVLVQNRLSGTATFSGSINDTGQGILLSANNVASTTTFSSGAVTLSTGTNSAFTATSGGTVNVTGSGNTLATGAAPAALSVSNTAIGASGLTFRSIAATSATNGIVLNNTGVLGGLTVSGTGSLGTGGIIQTTTGDAVSLQNTRNVSLSFMTIQNNLGSGVFGDDLTNFTLASSTVSGNGNTANGSEAGLRFNELLGTSTVSNSTITGSSEDNVRITPASGTGTLNVTTSTISANSVVTGGNGMTIIGVTTANFTLNVTGSTFADNRANSLLVNFTDNAAATVNVSGTTLRDSNIGISLLTNVNNDMTFNISSNTILRQTSNAINLLSNAVSSTNAAQFTGFITNNNIGDGTLDSGSRDAYGISGEFNNDVDVVMSVTGNNVRNTDFEGIFIQSRLDNDADAEVGKMDLTLRDNTVGNPDDNSANPVFVLNGTRVESRNTTVVCLDIASNTSGSVGGLPDFRVRQRDTSTFKLERFVGSGASTAAVAAFVAAENDAGSTAEALLATTFTGVANGACRKP